MGGRRGIMEGEISNFIMVWSLILASACYCHRIANLVSKSAVRCFMFLPVICLFFLLPLNLNSVSLTAPTAFFVTWLCTFKVFLLIFGAGPLSDPSLSLRHFVVIFCFPIKLKYAQSSIPPPMKEEKGPKKTHNKENLAQYSQLHHQNGHYTPKTNNSTTMLRSRLQLQTKGLILIFLTAVAYSKDKLPRDVVLFLVCIYIYVALEVLLGRLAIRAQGRLPFEVEPPFNEPYLSTSLQDFWGRRWNQVSSSILKLAVFDPVRRYASQSLGRKRAAFLALFVTFLVSGLMHMVMFYYLGCVRPGWGTPLFFITQPLFVIIESELKKNIDTRWQLPQVVMGPLVFGFAIYNFKCLVLPELMEHNVDDRLLEEYAAVGAFFKDLIAVKWATTSTSPQ